MTLASKNLNLMLLHNTNNMNPSNLNYSQYKEMFAKVQAGQITEQVWFDYCFETLSQILEDNKDIFVRLKNR